MKKMKIIGLIAIITMLNLSIAAAQTDAEGVKPLEEYKLSMTSGRLLVKEVNEVEFVGHSGSGVIIQASAADKEDSERAEGLKLINGLGLEDNTGLGLNISKDGEANVIQELSSRNSRGYIIQVPKGVTIVYEHSSSHGDDVVFKNILGEIESTTNHNDVLLENVTGPITINTVNGDIDGSFTNVNQANPISIVSSHGDIDIGIPENTKANLKIDTSWGEIYSDLNIAVNREEGNMKSYGGNNVVGTLNGGGVSFQVKSTHGSIYLRKK